jgi:hypothetical protein
MLDMPIPSLRLGLSGLKEYRTAGGHRRYDLNEVLRLRKQLAVLKSDLCYTCGCELTPSPFGENQPWCMCCYEINRLVEKDD